MILDPYHRYSNKSETAKVFYQVKKNQKNLRKTRKWVGGSTPTRIIIFLGEFCVFYVVFMFPNVSKKKKWIGG